MNLMWTPKISKTNSIQSMVSCILRKEGHIGKCDVVSCGWELVGVFTLTTWLFLVGWLPIDDCSSLSPT